MKKLLLSIFAVCAAVTINAQVDTLTTHMSGNPALYYADASPFDSGYVCGNNAYGDLVKLQKFDATSGITSTGTITDVLVAIPYKMDNGSGNFQIAIWGDNAGEPANILAPIGVVSVSLSAVDTAATAFQVADGAVLYNHVATFASPIAIPAGNTFWAGVVLPTGGSEIALFSNNISTNPYAASATHCGEIWSNGTYNSMVSAWGAQLSLCIFPVVNLTPAAISENVIETSVYPNPANDVLNIVASEEIATVSIVTLDGKVVANASSSSVNVAELKSGMYIYEVTTTSGKVSRDTFMKK